MELSSSPRGIIIEKFQFKLVGGGQSKHSHGEGLTGYLRTIADKRMDLMVGLIGKLMPIQREAGNDEPKEPVIYRTSEEIREALLKKGIPPRKVDIIMGAAPTNVVETSFTRNDDHTSS